ncbi:hypothetical protein EDB92DRAFT_2103994 [Lactarius akahatsu]|uniref:Uncharacterized protein n=1 Tax=Lactarius akahatsu TaxID=416441 RepID=A0AAD4LEE2_9AGAM|nr:hypothetical protein EDB92DRAFT_2103994 [Lactarius akahatsu]
MNDRHVRDLAALDLALDSENQFTQFVPFSFKDLVCSSDIISMQANELFVYSTRTQGGNGIESRSIAVASGMEGGWWLYRTWYRRFGNVQYFSDQPLLAFWEPLQQFLNILPVDLRILNLKLVDNLNSALHLYGSPKASCYRGLGNLLLSRPDGLLCARASSDGWPGLLRSPALLVLARSGTTLCADWGRGPIPTLTYWILWEGPNGPGFEQYAGQRNTNTESEYKDAVRVRSVGAASGRTTEPPSHNHPPSESSRTPLAPHTASNAQLPEDKD